MLLGIKYSIFGCLSSSLSTTEAQYIALTEASKETMRLKGLVIELGLKQERVYLAKSQVYYSRTKHIVVRYHRVRDSVN